MSKRYCFLVICVSFLGIFRIYSQETFHGNGVSDFRHGRIALTNARIIANPSDTIVSGILLIERGKVVSVGRDVVIPRGTEIIDMSGYVIYPSFVELSAPSLGLSVSNEKVRRGYYGDPTPQLSSTRDGIFGWNDALRSEYRAAHHLQLESEEFRFRSAALREAGFGTVLSFRPDGIARGTGVMFMLSDLPVQERILGMDVATFYSFDRGSSLQDYPRSLMGSVALLRQAHYDMDWYVSESNTRQVNRTLEAMHTYSSLPRIFSVRQAHEGVLARALAKEFGFSYLIKSRGDDYQRLRELSAGDRVIIPLDFPTAPPVHDIFSSLGVSYPTLLHWEMAPFNAKILDSASVRLAFTSDGLGDVRETLSGVRRLLAHGLDRAKALGALTLHPASFVGMEEQVGQLRAGSWANFLIFSKDLFSSDAILHEHWVQGRRYIYRPITRIDYQGRYDVSWMDSSFVLDLSASRGRLYLDDADTLGREVEVLRENSRISMLFRGLSASGKVRLTAWKEGSNLRGQGVSAEGVSFSFLARYRRALDTLRQGEEVEAAILPTHGGFIHPFAPYGWRDSLPASRSYLVRHATVWTGESAGILENTDVLLVGGKIAAIGKGLLAPVGARIIEGRGKHLTAGIVDEHSHIALYSINEWAGSVSSEVRMRDAINASDVNIYRQLAGGVTSAQLLHGSANPIGGQSALIKFRWGLFPEEMLIKGSAGFIKFALGENVKRSNAPFSWSERFPQTRMGVEQVIADAFVRAKAYGEAVDLYRRGGGIKPRKDLALEALLGILEKRIFITCHSYVTSEVIMLMRLAERMGFRVNTFTHILEGYKVADQLRLHGAGGSTFSDWWAYKLEVRDAIPYNAAVMEALGVLTAINSDDAEMGRRLNQEAAKAIKYGNRSKEEAWNMVTLNPARMLHLDDRIGSIRVGKDADVVLWSAEPLSVYAKAEKTFIDGALYYDRAQQEVRRKELLSDRARLIQKALSSEQKGGKRKKGAAGEEGIEHAHEHLPYGGCREIKTEEEGG